MKASLLGLLLIGAPASADPARDAPQRYPRSSSIGHSGHSASQARPVPAGATDNTRITTTSVRDESPARRASVDPDVASRLLGAQISPDHAVLQHSVVERPSTWVAPVKRESKPWRPKIMLYPMSSMASATGGKGIKVKFRF
jgi:hypothetical protein